MSSPRLQRPESRTRQVARNIRNDIAAGALRDGDVLPSTRDLAKQWNVSAFTISEAMKILADEGLIENKSRSKRIVRAPDQARKHEIRPLAPHVVLIGGYAGSGKTELGRILARETGWPMLDKDTLTRPIVETALELLGQSPHDRESDTYLTLIRPREYEALMAAAHENVECGNSAIVAAPFIHEFNDITWITRMQATFAAMDATTTLVWVYCDPETMRTYLRHRGAARDAAKLGNWPRYLTTIDIDLRPPVTHVLVNNSASSTPLQRQAKEMLSALLSPRKVNTNNDHL
jgi:DNA-binding transcriptional regulator YhcF (GntR family)